MIRGSDEHSVHMAVTNYRARERDKRLKLELAAFFSMLVIVCAALYFGIASIPYLIP